MGKAKPATLRRLSQEYHARHRDRLNKAKRERYAANKASELARFKARRGTVKDSARNTLRQAVFDGRIAKPKACESCGNGGQIHGHHDDYSQPLSVRWLCRICHGRMHRKE